jgi:hypothetical protein
MSRSGRAVRAAGASGVFLQRVKGEISAAQYVRALDRRVSERAKANESASKRAKKDQGRS